MKQNNKIFPYFTSKKNPKQGLSGNIDEQSCRKRKIAKQTDVSMQPTGK